MTPEVRAFVESLLLRIAELEEALGPPKNPRNSSLPPGCQHPHAKTPRKAPRSKRKRGGQPGHKKHERSLVPTEECQEVVTLLPKTCRRCDTPLTGEDSDPLRHQVWELPEIKPMITEYRRHRLACPWGRRDADQASGSEGMVVDLRGQHLHPLHDAWLAGGYRAERTAWRELLGRRDV
ncbi:DUF6444 domain-containing protein [Kolteria novifilia]|uniref:DUF6444 domain-containing protein n=1 Tax=Kolteria novifilia TaxID=2527975 RepID=UPI003AF3E5B4